MEIKGKTIISLREKTLLCVIMLTFLAGCSASRVVVQPDIEKIRPPFKTADGGTQVIASVLKEIDERNNQVENSSEWIATSYEGLKLRRLGNISEREYQYYKKFLDSGTVYVIVHPGYFSFFQYQSVPVGEYTDKDFPRFNVIERLLKLPPTDIKFSLLQAQERRMRDFLEYMSTSEKLVILVLPRNYQKFSGYSYRGKFDEYARYLNEVTNLSRSVLYVESKAPNRGYLLEGEMVRLLEFLLNIGAKKVYVGGGYVGRCLEDFYVDFTETYGGRDVYMVPELADVSPKELDRKLANSLLMPDGTINVGVATRNLKTDAYGSQETRPNLINLP